MKPTRKIIDLHCDTLTECHKKGIGLCNDALHFSLDKIPPGVHLCQAMAVFMPDEWRGPKAEAYFDTVYTGYKREMTRYGACIAPVCDLSRVGRALEKAALSVMLTVEGGSALAGKLESVTRLYAMGVRMMTLTWNAENEICGGSATDIGFSDFGRRAVGEMERLGMVVDVSHLSDRGFWELCSFAEKPFIASHSNARSVCPHPRNLTDDMFLAIKARRGIVGLNYYDNFIVKDGGSRAIDDLLRHAHHFLALGGADTLALGSDFDGADIPPYLDSLEKHCDLLEVLEKSGIPRETVDKISYGNALGFFSRMSRI